MSSSTTNVMILLLLYYTVAEELKCGRIKNQQLYREKSNPELDEFGWLGRMYIVDTRTKEPVHFCNAVLISQAHLVAPAHCGVIDGESSYRPEYVIFAADADNNNNATFHYAIQDIAIHPNYDSRKRINDIAVVHLARSVVFNNIIQPICLPPATTYGGVPTQYLPVVGNLKTPPHTMHVRNGIIIPFDECRKELPFLQTAFDATICALLTDEHDLSSGSALMGTQILNLKPTNYYLVAIASFNTIHSKEQYIIFTRIATYTNWIEENVRRSVRSVRNDLNKRLIFN